jgi:hypothetical protein
MTSDRILYANPAILATDATNLILTAKKTETHTVPFIPADSVKPLQVALINSTNALVTAMHLWTEYERDSFTATPKLAAFFSDIRTKYLQAQAKAQELDEQKGADA